MRPRALWVSQMGIRHLSAAMYDHVGLPPTAKLVLIAIADHINDETGYGWPSMSRLAHIAGVHKTNVLRWVMWLESEGHITIQRKPGRSNGYRLTSSATATSSADTSSGTATRPVALPLPDHTRQRYPNRKEPEGNRRRAPRGAPPTHTPPPVDDVLKGLEKYR